VLPRRYDLRDRFVFLGTEVPEAFDRMVAGRCLLIPMTRPAELVRVALAAVRRRTQVEAQTPAPASDLDFDESTHVRLLTQPRLLLAEDEPVLLLVIAEYLEQAGYTVTRVESGHAAIVLLSHDEFDAIVLDWEMDDGSGADVYQWIRGHRPSFGERVVFLSSGDAADADDAALGRPFFRKGQDASALTAVLQAIVHLARIEHGA
jgi:CheY-like chemotaxis protein